MSRHQGFARGDLDTSFPLDDKFLELRGSTDPLHYYAAVGVYFTVVAAAWREADRKPGARTTPDALDQLADLTRVGLLDTRQSVKNTSFRRWIGRALDSRKADAERKARNRTGMSGGTPSDSRVRPSESGARARQGQDGREEQVDVEGGPGGDDSAIALHERTGQFPSAKILGWLNDLAEAHSEARLCAVIRSTPMNGQNVLEYMHAVTDALRLEDHAADRSERAAEKRRNAEKRKPTVLLQPRDDISDEEAERLAREWHNGGIPA